jgi:hypothetical protein
LSALVTNRANDDNTECCVSEATVPVSTNPPSMYRMESNSPVAGRVGVVGVAVVDAAGIDVPARVVVDEAAMVLVTATVDDGGGVDVVTGASHDAATLTECTPSTDRTADRTTATSATGVAHDTVAS